MALVFKNFKKSSYNREQLVKENLISKLNETIEEIQLEYKENNGECLQQTDSSLTLCSILEAIFLHGLKDSLLWQTLTIISGNDADRKPEPNFWPLLLIILHAETIDRIEKLNQIKNDIGNCRAWIRLSLNESLFSSYIKSILKNLAALNPYYKSYAFLKDTHKLYIVNKILEKFEESVQINFNLNSSLINHWDTLQLQLSGIYIPALRSYPIVSGIDVANSLIDAETNIDTETISIPKPLKTNEIFSSSISNSSFSPNYLGESSDTIKIKEDCEEDLNEEENVRLLLQKIEQDTFNRFHNNDVIQNEMQIGENTEKNFDKQKYLDDPSTCSQELLITSIPQATENPKSNQSLRENPVQTFNRINSVSSTNSLKSSIDKYSYDEILTEHQKANDQEFNISNVWQHFESRLIMPEELEEKIENNYQNVNNDFNEEDSMENNLNFKILPKSEKFSTEEFKQISEYLCKLAREHGLDDQGFICKGCAHPLGIDFARAHVCSFSGNYFCDQCMSGDLVAIPSKIIYNWDFKKYNVSKRAASFLTEFQYRPLIDLKVINPKIYEASEEMEIIQTFRIQLNYIRVYFYNCRESSIEALKKQTNQEEHLYEHIHQYSIADLLLIPKGQLARKLQKIYQFGERHVLECNLCSLKGYRCEICKSQNVLYPFHINTTFTCKACCSVFHDKCLDQTKPCPKCRRKRERRYLTKLEALQQL